MAIKNYSTTAGNNTSIAGINIAEGCPRANINNAIRAEMADTRAFYEAATWTDLGHTPTRTGNTTFTINADVEDFYTAGRRIQCTDATVLYGTIVSAVYSAPNTTVTVTLDSGNLSASLTAVAVSLIDPTNDPIPATALSGTIAAANLPTSATDALQVGDIKITARSTAPSRWLLCQGQAISRTTYADLFTAIGTTYGVGDGSTTFNVPDLGGRVVAGKESSATRLTSGVSGVDGATLGAAGGNQNMHQHTHIATVTDGGHSHTQRLDKSGGGSTDIGTMVGNNAGATNGVVAGINNDNFNGDAITTASATTGISVSNANAGTGSSQNVQPTIVLNYIIYAGV